MISDIIYFQNVSENHSQNLFCKIYEGNVVFFREENNLIVNLKDVSNVRLIKRRVYHLNIVLSFISSIIFIIVYNYVKIKINSFFLIPILFILVRMSYLLKAYSFILLVNINKSQFFELKVSKQKLNEANNFAAFFKSNNQL